MRFFMGGVCQFVFQLLGFFFFGWCLPGRWPFTWFILMGRAWFVFYAVELVAGDIVSSEWKICRLLITEN